MINNSQPKISVCMVNYNHVDFVGKAIESVLSQTYQNIEFIIIDNASTDGSIEIIKSYEDNRIIYVQHEENLTGPISYFEAISLASGEYIAMMCSDDLWLPDKLEKQMQVFKTAPDLGAVFTWVEYMSEDEHPIRELTPGNKNKYQWLHHLVFFGTPLSFPSVVIKKSVVEHIGAMNPRISRSDDYNWWLRMLPHYDIHVINECLTRFRCRNSPHSQYGANVSGLNKNNYIGRAVEFKYSLNEFFANNNINTIMSAITGVEPDLSKQLCDVDVFIAFYNRLVDYGDELFVTGMYEPLKSICVEWLYRIFDKPETREEAILKGISYHKLIEITGKMDVYNIGRLFDNTFSGQQQGAQNNKDAAGGTKLLVRERNGMHSFNLTKESRYGKMIYNSKDMYVGKSLDVYGEFSEGEVSLFRQFVRSGNIVLEIGANIGAHTVVLSKMVGAQGKVIAYEPQRLVFQTLAGNLAINSIANAFCYQKAVGAVAGELLVPLLDFEKENNWGGLSLGAWKNGEAVEVITVDSLELPLCHFIKIDVEGMELDVLCGAKHTIQQHKPIMYVENDRPEKSDDLIRYIDSLGYDQYWHRPYLFNANNYYGNKENIFGNIASHNMLCIPKTSTINITGFEKVAVPTSC